MQKQSAGSLVSLPTENAIPAPAIGEAEPSKFSEIVGQAEAVRRLTALVDLAKRRQEVLGHVLLVGPDGSGKRTIAHVIARELAVNVRAVSGSAIERGGDLAAIVNDLEKGDILFVYNIGRLRSFLVDLLAPTLRRFVLDIVVGKGPSARDMRLAVKPFTLIGTVQKQGDCSPDLFGCFDIVISLPRYSEQEMLQLTERRALSAGLSLEAAVVPLVARLADSNPGKINTLLKRLKLVDKHPVGRHDAEEILSVFGYPGVISARSDAPIGNWSALSGVEFERLIVDLLNNIGFTAATTKASGDGGIDVEATLDRPIVGGRYLFQCKRLAPEALVGSPTVREFYGALVADRKAVKGVFITTSGYTAQARDFAQNLPIELIDGEQLVQLMSDAAVKNQE
ncbi:MAG: restriction endonuclease [Acidobacteriaceae bacterium]|nr:restriction endonuclease [Acidobacteriaceae bacterium]